MSWAQERYIREVLIECHEAYWHSGNGSGKTSCGVYADLALLRGVESVRGYFRSCCGAEFDPYRTPGGVCPACGKDAPERIIQLPLIKPPVSWGLGVPTYKIAAGSSLPMIRALLGKWPYQEIRQGNRNTVAQILIKHRLSRSDEPDETWSSLFIFPYDGETPEGVRLDGWHCDEPPPEHFLDALRTRQKAARKLRGGITATPIKRREWQPIRDQFPDELLKVEHGRIRIQSSVYDNMALTADDLRDIERRLAGRPKAVRDARLNGDHRDDSGSCPFDDALLDEMERGCRDPRREEIRIEREVETHEGKKLAAVVFVLETWFAYDPQDSYFLVPDIGKGIDDDKHDPCCFHVWSRRKKALCARAHKYLGGYGLAEAANIVGRRYGYCEIDPPIQGGYAEAFLSRLRQLGYHRFSHDRKHNNLANWARRVGFTESRTSNAEWFGAVEGALESRGITVQSRDVVRCLRELVKDENGKILAGPGYHDEDWVCLGRSVYKLGFDTGRKREPLARPALSGIEQLKRWATRQRMPSPIIERW